MGYLAAIFLNPVTLICAVIVFLIFRNKQYKKGAYYRVTKTPYLSVRRDKGQYAEYLTYKSLQHFEDSGGKFLFNIFVPKENGETTEIDVLLICSKGLFIFESKNYSGWIFGNEAHQNWTQTLPKSPGQSHKERFYNPIMQNASHIRHLKNLIGQNVSMRSIIVFSDRCTLKNITLKSTDVSVINRYKLAPTVAQICNQIQAEVYTESEINDIYSKLHPYTQFGYEAKAKHIESIRKKEFIYH
jgi:hypothetical protein